MKSVWGVFFFEEGSFFFFNSANSTDCEVSKTLIHLPCPKVLNFRVRLASSQLAP